MIKIVTTKVMEGGQKCRRVDRVEALTKDQLPVEYLTQLPHCYLYQIITSRPPLCILVFGGAGGLTSTALYPEPMFQERLKGIIQCGERLAQIKKEIRGKWQGEEVFEI